MDTIRTKERVQSLLGYVEISRMQVRRLVFWSYTVMLLAIGLAVALAFYGVFDVYLIVATLVIALFSGLLGYTMGRDNKRWRKISAELRSWLVETERLLTGGKPDERGE